MASGVAVEGITTAKLDLCHGPPLLDFQHALMPERRQTRERCSYSQEAHAEKLHTLGAFG